jgi:glycogen debranching enzyme
MPTSPQNLRQQIARQAQDIFHHNLQQGYSDWKKTEYRFIAPANTEYVFQWLWDTAFHAIVLSHFDPEWAKAEILNFLKGQHSNGFLPHVVFWQERKLLPHWAFIESNPWTWRIHTTAITQPPMLAIAAEEIVKKGDDKEFTRTVCLALLRHHRWLVEYRDPDKDGLLSIISPNESGMDELPVFQYVMGYMGQETARLHYTYRRADLLNQLYRYDNRRILGKNYFNVEELLFNCVFVQANRSLGRMLRSLKMEAEAVEVLEQANITERAIVSKCWDEDEGIFYSLFGRDERMAKIKTIASLAPLFLDGLPKGRASELVKRHLTNPDEFWTPYPVPSVARNEPFYTPDETPIYKVKLLWRGPTWINTNWFIVKGLRKHGYDELADHIVSRMQEMIARHGFREYYNPETGEGYRRKQFGWSTLLLDLL